MHDSIAALEAGLFASEYGERLCQQADAELAEGLRLEALPDEQAAAEMARARAVNRAVTAAIEAHLSAIIQTALTTLTEEVSANERK